MILLVDNYDSFVHNLARYLNRLGQTTRVVRNDQLSLDDIASWEPKAIVLSPGPCTPDEAGIGLDLVASLSGRIPILGVCLGHQTIVQALGGRIVRSEEPMHGRWSLINHGGTGIFADIPTPVQVGRYHSLVSETSLPETLRVAATTDRGIVMAVEHLHHPTVGLQFHPESVLTQFGYQMLANFLTLAGVDVPHIPDWQSEFAEGALPVEETDASFPILWQDRVTQ